MGFSRRVTFTTDSSVEATKHSALLFCLAYIKLKT